MKRFSSIIAFALVVSVIFSSFAPSLAEAKIVHKTREVTATGNTLATVQFEEYKRGQARISWQGDSRTELYEVQFFTLGEEGAIGEYTVDEPYFDLQDFINELKQECSEQEYKRLVKKSYRMLVIATAEGLEKSQGKSLNSISLKLKQTTTSNPQTKNSGLSDRDRGRLEGAVVGAVGGYLLNKLIGR